MKPLKQKFYSRLKNGSLFTKIVQNTLLVTFTFAKYSSQNELFWTYKREGIEPGAVTFYCKNSGRLCRSLCAPTKAHVLPFLQFYKMASVNK